MKHSDILLDVSLRLFDGEGGAAAPAAGEGAADDGNKGGFQASPAPTRRGKSGGFQNVLFGKQGDEPTAAGDEPGPEGKAQPSAAGKGKEGDVVTTSNTLEDRRKAFQELVNGEYKDIYTEETQRIIDRRFREARNLEERAAKQQPVIDMLMQRYKIADGDLGKLAAAVENVYAYWSEAA